MPSFSDHSWRGIARREGECLSEWGLNSEGNSEANPLDFRAASGCHMVPLVRVMHSAQWQNKSWLQTIARQVRVRANNPMPGDILGIVKSTAPRGPDP